MPAILRISEPTCARRGVLDNRVCVRFKLNHEPDGTWIGLFKAHAASSVLAAANAVFTGSEISIEVAKPSSEAELATALDCFIECANLGLRSFGGRAPERKPRVLRRPGLPGRV
jgi:hypothetical protein